MRDRIFLIALTATLLCLGADSARALSLSLGCFRDPVDTAACRVGADQFGIEVTEHARGTLFQFSNAGPRDAFMSEIYFSDASRVLGSATLNVGNIGDVHFNDTSVKPKNLPGATEIGFSASYAAQPDSPGTNKDGVDPGESLGILFSGNFSSIESALISGDLRVAVRGQGLYPDGESESFLVSDRPDRPIPEPGAALVFALGAALVAGATRRR